MGRGTKEIFSRGDIERANKCIKTCLTWAAIRECKSKGHWDIISHLSEWLSSKREVITSTGKDVEERGSLLTVGKNVNWHSHYGSYAGNYGKYSGSSKT